MNTQETNLDKKLIFLGALLFLFGILQGAAIPFFLNPRMALSAHLAAVQSGMALMIIGLVWRNLQLSSGLLKATYYSSVLSMFLIWIAISLAAIVGASKVLPIAGAGFSASYSEELAVEIIITSGSVFGVVSAVLVAWGLYKGLVQK